MRYPPLDERLPVVLVDFDGVLARSYWPSPLLGPPIPEGIALVRHYAEQGAEVRIFTARPDSHWPLIADWCEKHGIGDVIYDISDRKIPASLYVDDRAWRPPW